MLTKMKNQWTKRLGLSVSVLAVLIFAGCGTTPGHEKAVNNANARYHSMRSSIMVTLARQQFDTGDLDQASKTLMDALRVDPQNAQVHVLLGRIALERGQLERSYRFFDDAIALQPEYAESYYYQGVVLQRWQRFEASLAHYERAFDRAKDNAAYLLAVCEMLVLTDQQDKALELMLSKLDYFDQNAGVRQAVGHLYVLRREFDKALDYFRQAAMLRPDDVQLQEEIAITLAAAGRTAEASVMLEKLTRDQAVSKRPDLRRALGDCYVRMERLQDAKNIFLELIRLNDADVDAWTKLSEICWGLNDMQGALRAANRTIALAPQRTDGYLMAGMVWQKRGQHERAIDAFTKAAQVAPDSPLPLILRGITLEQAGRPAAAAEAYNEAIRRQPEDERAKKLLDRMQQQNS